METALGNKIGPSGIDGADFSEYQTQLGDSGIIYDTSQTPVVPFVSNVVPRAYLNRAASLPALNLFKLLESYSKGIGLGSNGNLNGLDSNYHGSGTGILNSDQWTVRGDYNLTSTMHAFGRFSRFTDTLTGKVGFLARPVDAARRQSPCGGGLPNANDSARRGGIARERPLTEASTAPPLTTHATVERQIRPGGRGDRSSIRSEQRYYPRTAGSAAIRAFPRRAAQRFSVGSPTSNPARCTTEKGQYQV
jgi:hypothetical protein